MVHREMPAQHCVMRPAVLVAMFSVISLMKAGMLPTEMPTRESESTESASVTLLVYDFAKLREPEWCGWLSELTHIMNESGIGIRAVVCRRGTVFANQDRCELPQACDLFVRIVDGRKVESPGLALGYLGLAEPGWGGRGLLTVMVTNVRDLASGTHWQFPDLLAHATAHEIGHLLGVIQHSSSGIMRVQWRKSAIKHMTHSGLVFSKDESFLMQREVRRRSATLAAQSHK